MTDAAKTRGIAECRRCGACCRRLLIECDWIDALREPRLLEQREPNRLGLTLADLEGGEKVIALWNCPLLGPDNLCTIYPTRPNECVAFEPGGVKCERARKEALAKEGAS